MSRKVRAIRAVRQVLGPLFLSIVAVSASAADHRGGAYQLAQADTFEQHLQAARQSAGTEWLGAIDYLCNRGQIIPNRPDDPLIEPVQIFDNVYAIGRTSTVVYVVTTSDGLILIDSGYGDQFDDVLLPGMAQLGLDPANVEYVFVLHGHTDHYGGATRLQERFGARVAAAAADWDLMESIGAGGTNRTPVPAPSRDVVVVDGEPIRVGDIAVTPFIVPGHTPGAIAVVFPVYDAGVEHTAAVFGGMALTVSYLGDAIPQYLASVERFSGISERMGVDVELQNHPLFDDMPAKLQQLASRAPGEKHPFVVAEPGSYQRFLRTVSECTKAQMANGSASEGGHG